MTAPTFSSASRLTRLGLLASAALILFLVEALAPRPVPWMKVGLGNTAVVIALALFGAAPAAAVATVKIAVGGLLSGGFGSPAFAIGGSAGLTSVAAMSLVYRCAPRLLSIVGLSILGAVTHQVTQLLVASAYLRHAGVFGLLPLFLLTGLVTGASIGFIAQWSVRRLWQAHPD